MSYTDFLFSNTGQLPILNSPEKKHWDIAISCYEPLDLVTGGIGTYTRLLIEILTKEDSLKNKNIALFCRRATANLKTNYSNNLTIFELGDDWSIYGKRAERLGNEHDWYSWNLAHRLLDMTLQGHTFGFFEFPDYAVEAYFPLKMKRAGLINIDTVSIRLHSPELMLFRDNLLPARSYDLNRLTRISRELFCYQHCDKIIYGAPAMLSRVEEECQRFGLKIEDKAVHIEHPYPVHNTFKKEKIARNEHSIHIGYIGRLETRKGILKFLQKISTNDNILKVIHSLNIVFELFGADCPDQYGVSIKSQILALQHIKELRGRIIVHGYMSQDDLRTASQNMDGFLFPSIFENYPNALLEVLDKDVPILISDSGGMPYISRGLPGIYQFSYNPNFYKTLENFFCSIRPVPGRKELYFEMANKTNKLIAQGYNRASRKPKINANKLPVTPSSSGGGVDFVIPFFNDSEYVEDCLKNIKAIINDKDRIFVVDDASNKEEAYRLDAAIVRIFGKHNSVTVHHMPVNSGPSAVRNAGAELGCNELIQFIDSDDSINETGFLVTKKYIRRNNDVDFVYGIQDNYGARSHVWIPRDSSIMTCIDENYTHSAIIIRRAVFEKIGGFDSSLRLHFEDWQFNCKLASVGYRGEVIPFVSQHYRVRNSSRTYLNLEQEDFSREQVIERTFINRPPQKSTLDGEFMELVGKYASMIHGRWNGSHLLNKSSENHTPSIDGISLPELYNLRGEEFLQTTYGVILERIWKWNASDSHIKNILGTKQSDGIYIEKGTKGRVTYGPYIPLEKGNYRVTVGFGKKTSFRNIRIEVAYSEGKKIIHTFKNKSFFSKKRKQISFDFRCEDVIKDAEFRIHVYEEFQGKIEFISLKRLNSNDLT